LLSSFYIQLTLPEISFIFAAFLIHVSKENSQVNSLTLEKAET
jgi:hypothetical protein